MLFLIGLGLSDVDDISVKGFNVVKNAYKVYLEAYTSILVANKEELEQFYGREVILADREHVEQKADEILDHCVDKDVAFLVVGDPFGATTHMDLVLRAKERGITYKVIHNASIMNAIGCCGLQLYSFGETVSIVMWTDTWQPDSYFDKIQSNKSRGLHTLCLLDIKMKEQTVENMIKGRKIYEPPRFMTASEAAGQLLSIVVRRRLAGESLSVDENTACVALARVGSATQQIVSGTLQQLSHADLGTPLHCFIVAGNMHELELDMLKHFSVDLSRDAS